MENTTKKNNLALIITAVLLVILLVLAIYVFIFSDKNLWSKNKSPVNYLAPAGWTAYINKEYGFRFDFPENLKSETSFKMYYNLSNKWRAGAPEESTGLPLITIPVYRIENEKSFPRYFAAELRIGVSNNPQDLERCLKSDPGYTGEERDLEIINGQIFSKFNLDNAAMMQYIKGTSYRILHNGTCFAIEQVAAGSNYSDEASPDDMSQEALDGYFDSIGEIVKTFRFTK